MLIRNSDRPRPTARFDNAHIPAGESCKRVLLLKVEAPHAEASSDAAAQRAPEQPLNLALVIDRSGSMERERLDAAKRAAAELCQALGERDRLSLVSFDDDVAVHFHGLAMTAQGRRDALARIHELHARGTTNLALGWHAGATNAAEVQSDHGFTGGHVIVLSDGHANRGMRDPADLQKHARELASRGVRTSAVGIGDDYSPLQLDALAEGGQGQLHDSARGEELAAMLLGEARELRATRIRDLELTLHGPENILVHFVTHRPVESVPGTMKFALGDLPAGRRRVVGLLLEVPPYLPPITQLPFDADLAWSVPMGESGGLAPADSRHRGLAELVTRESGVASARDLEVVEQFVDLYEAALIYEVAVRNERRDYGSAENLVHEHRPHLEELVRALPDAAERLHRLQRIAYRAPRDDWEPREKRNAFISSKKERDFHENHSHQPYYKRNL